jgi:bifunctional UDP-N-acetylglucosamine pyrophosphorylase/glucosamine-1-phosphate N-acetyltransferase
MRSSTHKVLHRVAGRSMIWHVLAAVATAGIAPSRTVVVVGDRAPDVETAIRGDWPGAGHSFAVQAERLGTGHATLVARPYVVEGASTVVVAYGDTPLLQADTVARLVRTHHAANARVTLVTGDMADPTGYGRIIRDGAGEVVGIVEERDATIAQRAIREVNSGFCAFDAEWMWETLPTVAPAANGEIYLTALAGIAAHEGRGRVATLHLEDVFETVGVNSRAQLAEAEAALRRRIVDRWLEAGVTFEDPTTAYVGPEAIISPDTVIAPNVHLRGATRVGARCTIGPNTILEDANVGDGATIVASVVRHATIPADASVGPFATVGAARRQSDMSQ